ncbi:hypothetical protein COOONC_03801 [Cooperia oncophora]
MADGKFPELTDILVADVIIHIRDLSNPDWPAQSEDVELTLGQIGLPPDRLNDVHCGGAITIDLDGAPLTSSSGAMRISCKTSEGIENLIEKVDEPVLSLELKCNMTGVTDFTPSDPENHRWFLKVRSIQKNSPNPLRKAYCNMCTRKKNYFVRFSQLFVKLHGNTGLVTPARAPQLSPSSFPLAQTPA